ncbi:MULTISPECIES: non-ribosomal peptide synthetase [Brevibacillus]|uniref:non-ribosomal peptide synthetase n=1 Tax=Brevibacillus TaxID=55080 RepID=UPI000EE1BD50|nr:amino acid adenylation domain-containing protein [Brevibacillus sp.]HBZ81137.1 non-ribosomal peptide synthetase [Brevibacillus sp.]
MGGHFDTNVSYLNDMYKKEYEYWQNKLAGAAEKSCFFAGAHDTKAEELRMETADFVLPSHCANRLVQISNHSDARLHVLLLAYTAVLLMKHTGQTDIVLGTSIYRQQANEEFINTVLPIRIPLTNEMPLLDVITDVRQTVSEAIEHQNYPIELILKNAKQPADFLDVSVILANIQELSYLDRASSNLILAFDRQHDELRVRIHYNALLYQKEQVERLVEQLSILLEHSLNNPRVPLKELSILTAREQELFARINETAVRFPEKATISSLFEEAVQAYPQHTAVVFEQKRLSYDQLNQKANQLAHCLRERGVTAESIVAVLMPPSVDMIVAILAVLKAGGAYLPIDPDLPAHRVEYMRQDSQAAYVVTLQAQSLGSGFADVIFADDERLNHYSVANLEPIHQPNQLAYIIYTSGTTGNPKGVMIEHRNVVRLFFHDNNRFAFSCDDTWVLFHSFGFDFSVWEIFGALLHGGKLLLLSNVLKRDYRQLVQRLREEQVTVWNQTPSSFYQFIEEELKQLDKKLCLRYVIFGGEALLPAKLAAWHDKYPETKLINMYGITETTVHTTYKEIAAEQIRSNEKRIGVPFSTVHLHILNRQGDVVPTGVVGEICIGGEGVARGYLNKPELTAERFQLCQLGGQMQRLYRSGDLGRYSSDGEVEYIGRRDKQVKIRGYRIELDEVRSHLLTMEGIQEAVVMAREIEEDGKILCAYVVMKEEQAERFDPVEIRQYMQTRVADYMIPSFILLLDKIPLTINGKVDDNQLLQMEFRQSGKRDVVQPGTELEKQLAEAWGKVLKTDSIGIHSTIFDLGGTSFDVLKISKELTDQLGREVTVVTLFTYPTISMLANVLEAEVTTRKLQADARLDSIEDGKKARLQKLRLLKK